MPRPRNPVRTVEINISIPQDLAAAMDALLWDPVLQKPRYGARSSLVSELITNWVKSQNPSFEQESFVVALD